MLYWSVVAAGPHRWTLPQDKITLVKGKVEEVTLPVDKVDIIISEWMGYFLLYESMLDTVLVARDKWLVEGGLLFPDKATMYMCAIEDGEYKEEKIACACAVMLRVTRFASWFTDVLCACVEPFSLGQRLRLRHEPHQEAGYAGAARRHCRGGGCPDGLQELLRAYAANASWQCKFLTCAVNGTQDIDINTVTKEQLAFTSPFSVTFTKNDFCHAVVSYFDVDFSPSHKPMKISTGPADRYTHWKQTVFYLVEPLAASAGDTLSVRWVVCDGRHRCVRHYSH